MVGLVNDYPEELRYRTVLASYYARTDQNDKAEAVLRDSIAADPEDDQRYLLLASFFANKYDNDRAITELEGMVKANPERTKLQFALAQLYLKTEQSDRAEAVYQKVIEEQGLEPDGLTARTAIATLRARQGKLDEAKLLIDEVLKENPKDNNALLLKGRVAMQEKDYTDAVAAFRSVLKDQSDSAEVLTLLAVAHQANGDTELATENLLRAVEVQPDNVMARLRLAAFIAQGGDLDGALVHVNAALEAEPANVNGLRAKAEILAKQGDTEALEEVLGKLEQASPETGLGSFGKGRLYKSQKKYDEAIVAFEEALKREPDSVLALTELVNTEIAMGDTDAAVKRLKTVLEENPGHRAAHDLLGIVYMAKQDFASAEQEFSRQLEVNDKSSIVYSQIAAARARQGNVEGAVQALKDGLAILPGDQRLILGLAGLYAGQGDLDSAANTYEQGIKADPENARFPLALAGVRERQRRFEEAITIYEQAHANNPDNLIVVNNLASLLSDHREDEQSLARAKELASKLAETNQPALLDTLGWVHYRLGEYEQAAEVLSGVVEKAPDVPVFRYHLGMTYYKQGDNRAAKEILSGAVAEVYNYGGVDEARRVYAEISE